MTCPPCNGSCYQGRACTAKPQRGYLGATVDSGIDDHDEHCNGYSATVPGLLPFEDLGEPLTARDYAQITALVVAIFGTAFGLLAWVLS